MPWSRQPNSLVESFLKVHQSSPEHPGRVISSNSRARKIMLVEVFLNPFLSVASAIRQLG
jgi:hypothetical protein